MRDRALALLVAVMLVTAALPAGLASAQSDAYQKTVDGHPEQVVIKYGDMDGEFEVQISSADAPGGDTVLREVTVNTNKRVANVVVFNNYGAYETVTATVTPTDGATGEPTFGDENALSDSTDLWDPIGGTGGDRDLTCDTAERLGTIVNPDTKVVDCMALPGSTTVNTTDSDANQTKLNLYQSAQNADASAEDTLTSIDNWQQDSETTAKIKAKNAYIRSLNNGSSKAAATTEAKQAASEYLASQQRLIATEWNIKTSHGVYMKSVASNESGISPLYAGETDMTTEGDVSYEGTDYVNYTSSERTLTLVNDNSTTVNVIEIQYKWDYANLVTETQTYGLTDTGYQDDGPSSGSFDVHGVSVNAPSDSYEDLSYVQFGEMNDRWEAIEQSEQNVHGEIETLVDGTYEAYQNGEINNSDLVDPYVLSSEYSPGSEYQGWAAAQLTLLGQNSPENFDQIGEFNVTTSGGQYSGVLFSQENPASGQFDNGTTYDPSEIGGTQYVVTDESIKELNENFTISSITTHDGESRENVTIVEKQYQTTNVTELKQLYEDLAFERAQIEAREKALKSSGGAGGFLPDMGGNTGMLLLVGAGAAAALYLNGDD